MSTATRMPPRIGDAQSICARRCPTKLARQESTLPRSTFARSTHSEPSAHSNRARRLQRMRCDGMPNTPIHRPQQQSTSEQQFTEHAEAWLEYVNYFVPEASRRLAALDHARAVAEAAHAEQMVSQILCSLA